MALLFLAPAFALIASAAAFFATHLEIHQFEDAINANKASFLLGLGIGIMTASVMLYIQLRYFSRHRSAMGRFTANGCVLLAWVGALASSIERGGDNFWRWGLFYYNPSDPTLFIQHRSGPGYTMNFANMMAWPVVLLVVADLVFLFLQHPHH
jgi:hypothetical protein